MNTLASAELIKDYADGNPLRMTEALLESSTNPSDSVAIFSGGVDPLRVTVCWTDPPGAAQTGHDVRTAALVNDLDLHVIGPGGTNYPYKLDYSNPTNNATTGTENNVDNVEQVYIETPVAGLYTIAIDYDGVLEDGEQWYSLLISGTVFDSDGDALPDFWEFEHFSNPTGAVAGVDSDGDGPDNLSELIAGTLPNDPNSVFAISSFNPPPNGTNLPFILNWNTVAGRLYSVNHSPDLMLSDFTTVTNGVDLPHTQNSYTDSVERANGQNFYRVDVRLP